MAVVVIVGAMFINSGKVDVNLPSGNGNTVNTGGGTTTFSCPTDLAHTLTYSVKNVENKTGDETFDTTYRFISDDGTVVAGTDSTAGSVALTCGKTYTIKQTSSSGADGDSAIIQSIVSGNAQLSGGEVTYAADGPSHTLILGGSQHGVLEVRAKDVINDGFMFDDQDGDATDFETDGVTFNSTTATTQTTAISAGGEANFQLEIRPTIDDNNWGDIGGYYILVDAATTVWNEPTVKVDGKTYTDVKDGLNSDEAKAYNGYEYVYKVQDVVRRTDKSLIDLDIFALSGVDPGAGDDLQIDLAPVGAYTSVTNSNDVKTGAVQDDSSQTQVHTLIDVTFDIS